VTSRKPPLTCTGRTYDARTAKPVWGRAGRPCGQEFPRDKRERDAPYETRARAAGWRLGPPAEDHTERHVMCPSCAKPDPKTTTALKELANVRKTW
jgi:hypothetical protein